MVKDLPATDDKGVKVPLKLTYQVELSSTKIDENPSVTSDDAITARLYATYNGLFAGYVRDDSGVTIAEGNVEATAATALSDLKVFAKFGTQEFAPGASGLVDASDSAATSVSESGDVFGAVASGAVTYDVATKTSNSLAKTGTYTVVYSFTQNAKEATITKTFAVSNSVFIPSVTVTTRNIDTLGESDIIAALKTNVDMNNNESEHESIANPAITSNTATKAVVKSVEVVDNYSNNWTFVIPVNATFTAN